jgi:hypothetical protein
MVGSVMARINKKPKVQQFYPQVMKRERRAIMFEYTLIFLNAMTLAFLDLQLWVVYTYKQIKPCISSYFQTVQPPKSHSLIMLLVITESKAGSVLKNISCFT